MYDYYETLWVTAKYGEPDENGLYDCIECELHEFVTAEEIDKAVDESKMPIDIQKFVEIILKRHIDGELKSLYVSDLDGKILVDVEY